MTKFLSKDGKFYMRDGKLLRPTNILEVPIVTSNLTYNGTAQSPTIYGYDENTMTMSGVTSGTDAGTYHITFTPKSGYEWSDDITTAKSVVWSIGKAAGALSLSTNSLILGNEAGSFTVNHVGDGAIQATSSDTSVATVDVSGNTVTVNRAVGKTWLLEDYIDCSDDNSFTVNFVSNNKHFTGFELLSGVDVCHYLNGSNSTKVGAGGSILDEYRILTFDEVPTGALLAWLQANATQYSETWVINETPTITTIAGTEIGSAPCMFTLSDGTTYQSSYFMVGYTGKMGQYISAENGTAEKLIYAVNSALVFYDGWYDSGCRTITFLEPPTGDLLTWLQANAVKQEKPVTITVTVGEGTNYKAVTSGETCAVTFAEGVSVPTCNSLTYNGSAQYPTWSNYDPNKMTIGGTTSATNAGTYTATFTLKAGYSWAGGSTATRSVAWTIYKATIAAVPTQSGSLTYNGSTQYPSWSNYDSNKMTIGGTTSAVNVGTYTATFTPTANYRWPDWTTTAKNVTWTIGKIAGSLSLSASSMTIDTNSTTGSFTVTHVGDGAISATSSAPDIAAVSVSGNTVTVTKNAVGTATITVSMAETAGYSGASATCTVRCRSTTGALPVGSSVYMNVGGFKTEFLVVNQGNPDASLYDSSCDGTWLLMRHVYEADFRWAKSSDRESYDESAAHSYLNGTFLGKFDSDIQNTIKQVKIPYGYKHPQTAIHSKEDGLAAKIFLLSAREVNYYGESTTIADGMPLKYFESCPTYAGTEEPRRVAKLLLGDHSYTASDGISWWLRSHNPGADSSGIDVWAVGPKGNSNGGFPTRSSGYGNRPALILPSNMIVNELGFVVANNT